MNFNKLYKKITNEFNKAIQNKTHGFHLFTIASITKNNLPKTRAVVLRNFDDASNSIFFHTDIRSPKINELNYNNNVMLHLYDPSQKVQLRLKAKAFIHHQDDIAQKAWEESNLFSRKCYLTELAPGDDVSAPIDGLPEKLKGTTPEAKESEEGYKNFAVISCVFSDIEYLHLDIQGHRKCILKKNGNEIKGQWVIP